MHTWPEGEQGKQRGEKRVLSASLPNRGGWLIHGGFAIKGARVGEAGWRVD
jgi:hypothetical protein